MNLGPMTFIMVLLMGAMMAVGIGILARACREAGPQCTRCKEVNRKAAKFCARCGQPL